MRSITLMGTAAVVLSARHCWQSQPARIAFVKKSAVKAPVEPRASRGVIASTCAIETTTTIGAQVLNSMDRKLTLTSAARA